MVYGILVAAGSGSRIGFRKQYAVLAGVEMWERSARALLAGGVDRLCIVVPEADRAEMIEKVKTASLHHTCRVVTGGDSRIASVAQGMEGVLAWIAAEGSAAVRVGGGGRTVVRFGDVHVQEGTFPGEAVWVAVHDAARPFVAVADVQAVIEVAKRDGAAVLGKPCVDTIKRVQNQKIVETVPREMLWNAQTPQVFRLDWLVRGLRAAGFGEASRSDRGPVGRTFTDDASLLEAIHLPVTMVAATTVNLKVTTQDDLPFATWLAERLWGQEDPS